MTRKRFKKLCMGLGFQWDHAEVLANIAWFFASSFAEAWPQVVRADAERRRGETEAAP